MIATDSEAIMMIQRVGFTFREPDLFHGGLGCGPIEEATGGGEGAAAAGGSPASSSSDEAS